MGGTSPADLSESGVGVVTYAGEEAEGCTPVQPAFLSVSR